ncbi:MAG: gamma-glutamyltransferase [Gemmatimonadales bacterium]
MLATLCALLILGVQSSDSSIILKTGVRTPAYSPTGRLALEINGDLWLREPGDGGPMVQLTSGPAWDVEPAWTPDGKALVFSSNRAGNFDLWKIEVVDNEVGDNSELATPTTITSSPDAEGEPSVAANGDIVFTRGRGPLSDLWILSSGEFRRLTKRKGAERSPAVSPDGRQVAYVSELAGRRQLRIRSVDGDDDRLVIGNMQPEYPTWSPQGNLIAFATRRGHIGVWITPVDGHYTNLMSTKRAYPAWLPDGKQIALAELPRAEPTYNGDPNRLDDRKVGDLDAWEGRLWLVPAPAVPDAGVRELQFAASTGRAEHNGQLFDRVWNRMKRLYYRTSNAGQWDALKAKLRPRAVAAHTREEAEAATYEIIRQHPHMRTEVSGKAAVSSANSMATAAGIAILQRGGNVIDAAVAVSFVLGVVEPDASGPGGYGEMVLYLSGMTEPAVIEFLTRVPEHGGLDNAALLENGSLPSDGPVLANVPGTVAGMWKAWKEYGSGELKWAELVEPAIQLAENGFVLDDAFTTTLARERDRFLKYESSTALFFPNGEPLAPGDTLRNADLAWTLRQIAEGGADAFYRGPVAKRLVSDLRGKGNAISLSDMARYFAATREPVRGTYHGHTIYSSAPAASGGASLIAKLNLLDQFAKPALYTTDAATLHAMIEAWKLAPSLFGRLADPDLWPVDIGPALDKASAKRRWGRCFKADKSSGPAELGTNGDELECAKDGKVTTSWGEELPGCDWSDDRGCRSSGTTAFALADADGNLVAVTQTLGTWGGNFYVSPGLGFLYNDKMRSYRTDPAAFGARIPFSRHSTSIAPTLVFKGTGEQKTPFLAVGAAGNAWITSAVYQMVAATIDRDLGPQDALELPRFLVGVRRQKSEVKDIVVQIEDGFAPEVIRRLKAMGHEFQRISLRGELRMGYGAAVRIDGATVTGGADPRRSGAAAAIR